MKKGVIYTLIISFSLAILSGCKLSIEKDRKSGSYDSNDYANSVSTSDANSACTRKVFEGTVVDGYIKGATVCFDFNNNNYCDYNEPKGTTDQFGAYQIKFSKRANPNSIIIAYGGIDIDTNSEFKGILKTTAKISNISASTTLVANLVLLGVDQELAKQKVATLFDIDSSNITKDPIKEFTNNPKLFKKNYKILKIIETAAEKETKNSIDKSFKKFAIELKKSNDLDDIIYTAYNQKVANTLKEMQSIIEQDLDKIDNRLDYIDALKTLAVKAKIKISQNLDENLANMIDIIKKCKIDQNLDDSHYIDTPPSIDIKYNADDTLSGIESAFNNARAHDNTVAKSLKLPHEFIWNSMSQELQALYIINKERADRGLKPFEGVVKMELEFKDANVSNLAQVTQAYANLLYSSETFSHTLDGTPLDRIDRVNSLKEHREFIPYVESLYMSANSQSLQKYPLIKAIYSWLYMDKNSNWGHRKMLLMRVPSDNFAQKGAEGILSFGLAYGTDNPKYRDWYSTYVVLDIYNPNSSWQGEYKSVPLCLSF